MPNAKLTDDETERLVGAPFAVLALVAGADGQVDRKEIKRFEQMIGAASGASEPRFGELMQIAVKTCDAWLVRLNAGEIDGEARLRDVATLLATRLDPPAAEAFRLGLVSMGERIADASGGGLLGFGKRTASQEAAVLSKIRQILGVG
jgi:hypothetical protein